jgi:hypothetical protein
LIADAVALFDAFEIKRTHFVGPPWADDRGGPGRKTSDRLNWVVACDWWAPMPQSAQQWAERIAIGRVNGMEALVEQTIHRAGFRPSSWPRTPVVGKRWEMIRTTPLNGFVGCAYAPCRISTSDPACTIKNECCSCAAPATLRCPRHERRLMPPFGLKTGGNPRRTFPTWKIRALFNVRLKDFL